VAFAGSFELTEVLGLPLFLLHERAEMKTEANIKHFAFITGKKRGNSDFPTLDPPKRFEYG
jgi:hypothetical protein